jgi:hypothetical protein
MDDLVKDDFEKALPSEILNLAVRSGTELVIPVDEAKHAVRVAAENRIAVLGVEVLRLLDIGLGVETYSGYEFKFDGNWESFVRLNNDAALLFISENSFGSGYGYILTATSETEFSHLGESLGLRRS